MKKQTVKLMVAVASSLMAFSASAAEPCKAYVKMDLGYAKTLNTRSSGVAFIPDDKGAPVAQSFYNKPLYKDPRGLALLAGAGYAFNDAMRAEMLLGFKPKMKSSDSGLEVDTRELGADARVLYDFNNNTPVTPFIFGSLGVSSIKPKVKPDLKSLPLTDGATKRVVYVIDDQGKEVGNDAVSLSQKSKTVMTYGVGGGLSFKTSDVMNIDFTYGMAKKGNFNAMKNVGVADKDDASAVKNSGGNQSAKFKKQVDQSVTIGLRFTM